MKTGTITFHAPNNNGSFLQAYALQKVLIREFWALKTKLLISDLKSRRTNIKHSDRFAVKMIC